MFSVCSIEFLIILIHYRKTAAQDQALRTNSIRKRIDREDISALRRICGEREEKISLCDRVQEIGSERIQRLKTRSGW